MKKSIMKGMSVLIAGMAFASCSHDAVYDENYAEKEKVLTYEQAFIQKYGAISPTQDWDFTRSAASASTRGVTGETASVMQQIDLDTESFAWLWKYSDTQTGALPQATFNTLWKSASRIKGAIDAATPQTWDPSKYDAVSFRVFTACLDKSLATTSKLYYRFGMHVPNADGGINYWLAQATTKYKSYSTKGTDFMDHTRRLDFTKLPQGTFFYASALASNETDTKAITASDYAIEYYKEVVWKDAQGNSYTFWAFNCNKSEGDDLILWVEPTAKTPDVITSKRYMCEDLGGVSSSDIDFNDIVFDLVDTNGAQKCYVRAMGGTLDIAIMVAGQEVFRKTTYQNSSFTKTKMYNTGWDGNKGDYNSIEFDKALAEVEVSGWTPNTNNVSVVVYNPTANPAETLIEFPVVGSVPKMVAVDVQRNWKEEKAGVPDFAWFSDFSRK